MCEGVRHIKWTGTVLQHTSVNLAMNLWIQDSKFIHQHTTGWKVNVPVDAIMTYTCSRSTVPFVLNLCTESRWVNFIHWLLYPEEATPTPIYRARWASETVWTLRIRGTSSLVGFRTRGHPACGAVTISTMPSRLPLVPNITIHSWRKTLFHGFSR